MATKRVARNKPSKNPQGEKAPAATAPDDNDDEDEEEDEDYNPELNLPDDDCDEDETDIVKGYDDAAASSHLSTVQLLRVDKAFEQIFGYTWGTAFCLGSTLTLQQSILVEALGTAAAASILQTNAPTTAKNTGGQPHKTTPARKQQRYKAQIPRAASSMPTSVATTRSGAAPRPAVPAPAPGGGGVQNLLKQLAGPTKVSTVAKTSSDWDKFKETTGLGEKLEENVESKEAYLKRKDFLTRVDHRQFELEKTERERSRTSKK